MATRKPNVLVTGTPGTGKTTTAQQAASGAGLRYINVGDWVKEKELHDGWDDEFDCYTVDEDKVVDAMEEVMSEGGNIVDYHSCDFFPERGYTETKVKENVECEIMQVLLEEARESYKEEIIKEVQSNTVEEMEQNVESITQWVSQHQRR